METGIIVKNIVIIGAILGAVFASQQPWARTNQTNYVYSENVKNNSGFIQKASNWMHDNVIAKIPGLGNGGAGDLNPVESVKQEVANQKNNFIQNTSDVTREFLAKEVLQILHVSPNDVGACPAN